MTNGFARRTYAALVRSATRTDRRFIAMTRSRPFIIAMSAWPLLAGANPASVDIAASAPPGITAYDCARFDSDIGRTEAARRDALEQSENAWKAVVPFVVLARKVSSKATVDEADKKLAELRLQAQRCVGSGTQ
jgi:hypothetical protein